MADAGIRKGVWPGLLLVLMSAGGCTYWSDDFSRLVDQSTRDFSRDLSRVYRDVEFADVVAHPDNFMLTDFVCEIVLDRHYERAFVWMHAPFKPENYHSFSAWDPSVRLWDPEERKRSLPTLFMEKINSDLGTLLSAGRYSRLRIRGRVLGSFENLPWIDVTYVDVSSAVYSDASLAALGAGLKAAAEQRTGEAVSLLGRALEGPLEAFEARTLAHMDLAGIYEERGDFEMALRHYGYVLNEDPSHVKAREGKERVMQAWERQRVIDAMKERPAPEPPQVPVEEPKPDMPKEGEKAPEGQPAAPSPPPSEPKAGEAPPAPPAPEQKP